MVARFGIQKTDSNHKDDTNGYTYGNITLLNHNQLAISDTNPTIYNDAVMLFVNRTLFKHIYNIYLRFNRDFEDVQNSKFHHPNDSLQLHSLKLNFCRDVHNSIKSDYYDEKCNNNSQNKLDFVRYVPCRKGKQCDDPYQSHNLTDYQFTYVIDNPKEPT